MIKNILAGSISVLLGIVFLFSAYTKLYPIELFEFSFIEIKVANWTTAPYIARFFLAFEFFLGLLLILNFKGNNRLVAKTTLGLLIAFTLYLLAIIILQGNNGNCGCFGTYIKMTPLESIIKNIVLMGLCAVLLFLPEGKNYFTNKTLLGVLIIGSFMTPFILNPLNETHPPDTNEINYTLKLDALYANERLEKPKVDLRQGKRVIAFLSLTCPHCKIATHKLNLIHEQYPELPIYYILNGDSADLKNFMEETKTRDIAYCFMSLKEGFVDNAGLNLPSILWVKDAKVENRTKYTELEADDLMKWYRDTNH